MEVAQLYIVEESSARVSFIEFLGINDKTY